MNQHAALTANTLAANILSGFALFRVLFESFNDQAKQLFEARDWHGVQRLSAQRIASNNEHLNRKAEDIRARLGGDTISADKWRETKYVYTQLIRQRYDYELAETFFNSIYRRLHTARALDPEQMFVYSAFERPPLALERPIYDVFAPTAGVTDMLRRLLFSLNFARPWQDFDRDVQNILRSLTEELPQIDSTDHLEVHLLRSLFFRNKGAYAIGRLVHGNNAFPVALALLMDEDGQIYVDTLICTEDELSIMFSFTRSYFIVDTRYPSAMVDFLHGLLPNKKRSELYAAIGLHKHGKTEFYRGFLEHLDNSDDQFVIAAGIKGMVMSVFTLPSYQTVFKVIKDRFAPQKNITRQQVREQYHIVKLHDRVGRMADTQEFEYLSFPRERFAPDLIEELSKVAASSLELTEDRVVIKHLYTERLMVPLNIYVENASEAELRAALDEYGNAIRQLAAANIFPGDMLLKNFGVTRHGRVVFYDYDEICYLTDVNFRRIPEPQTPEQEMAAEVWYSVAPNDVFPEEFARFLFGKRKIKAMFTEMHGDLFDPAYWRELQDAIAVGEIRDVYPYRHKRRFRR